MSGMGNQLREARELRHLTVSDVAAATHLKILVIDAMERDQYAKLIAPPYAKGFFRLYCEHLGLDANPFIDAYLRSMGISNNKPDLVRDTGQEPGLFSGLQKRMQEMQERKEVQRKAKEIAAAHAKVPQRDARTEATPPAGIEWEKEPAAAAPQAEIPRQPSSPKKSDGQQELPLLEPGDGGEAAPAVEVPGEASGPAPPSRVAGRRKPALTPREEADELARKAEERRRQLERALKQSEEDVRRTHEESERRAREEVERKTQETEQTRRLIEKELKKREIVGQQAREEAEAKVREEAKRKVQKAEDHRRQMEETLRAKDREVVLAREEAEKRILETEARRAKEAVERQSSEESLRQLHAEEISRMREEAVRRAHEDAEEKAATEFAQREEERIVMHKQEESERLHREEALRNKQAEPPHRPLELEPGRIQKEAPPPDSTAESQAAEEWLKLEQARQAKENAAAKRECAERDRRASHGASQQLKSPSPPPKPADKKPRIPWRDRLAPARAVLRRKFDSIHWHVWRTLLGILVAASLWIGMAHACGRSRDDVSAAPAVAKPLTESCCPVPEPYLD